MLNLKGQTHVQLQAGQKAYYPYRKHVSVGFDAECDIQDASVLTLLEVQTQYHTPDKLNEPGWTGGDNASSQFVFQAQLPGTTELRVRHMFRGRVEDDYTIKVDVSEAP